MYRVPVLNFNSKPFNGEKYDNQVLQRATIWSGTGGDVQDANPGQRNQGEKSDMKSTHFISIPIALNSIDIQQSFKGFRETILGDKNLDVVN